MPRTYTPIFDKVAIKEMKLEEVKSQAGLIVPQATFEQVKNSKDDDEGCTYNSPEGEVVAVGPDVKGVKVGDRVVLTVDDLLARTGKANQVILDGVETWVIQEKFITGVLDAETK